MKPFKAALDIPLSPCPDSGTRETEPLGDGAPLFPSAASKMIWGSLDEGVGKTPRPGEVLEVTAGIFAQHQGRYGATGLHGSTSGNIK